MLPNRLVREGYYSLFPCKKTCNVCFSSDLKDEEFLKEWTNQGLLSKVDGDDKSRFSIPQVLIDGVSIGDGIDLQDLEEDSDLGK